MKATYVAGQFIVVIFIFLTSYELGARYYWYSKGVPILHADKIIEFFYPELEKVKNTAITTDQESFQVLMLGGSVLREGYGSIEPRLQKRLATELNRPVVITNLAIPSHTSRDSLIKYHHIKAHRYDLIILYDSINDLRANNCPPSLFRENYDHFHWYRLLNPYLKHYFYREFAVPITLKTVYIEIAQRAKWMVLLPKDAPRIDEWKKYGEDIKTGTSLRNNYKEILDHSSAHSTKVVLMSFAYYIPQNYSLELFRQRKLDYYDFISAIEIWGEPRFIKKGLDHHNRVLQQLAGQYPNVIFVDQNNLVSKGRTWFRDICHLTGEGSQAFSDNIIDALKKEDVIRSVQSL